MTNNLTLITTETFGDLPCNFYRNINNDILLTREQIGSALEYANPRTALSIIHKKHKDRLDALSVKEKLKCSDGKLYNSCLYTLEGVLIICSLSQQEKSHEFSKWISNISNTNIKVINSRKEIEFMKLLKDFLKEYNIKYIQQYKFQDYKIDLYLPELKIAIEYDEEGHKYYSYENEKFREEFIKQNLGCKFIRLNDADSHGKNIAIISKEIL